MQTFFITSIGTDVGKTLVTTALCWQLRQLKKSVTGLKPVITGYDPGSDDSDTALILKSCGINPTPPLIETVSPWRFAPPFSPNMAAVQEGRRAPGLDEVVQFCREHTEVQTDALLVEGVGGVMSPLNDSATMLDWMEALGWPVILVAGSYLGALSHTLTALETLRARGLSVRALVVSESCAGAVPLADTIGTLEKFVPPDIPLAKVPRLQLQGELWKQVPSIHWMCSDHDG